VITAASLEAVSPGRPRRWWRSPRCPHPLPHSICWAICKRGGAAVRRLNLFRRIALELVIKHIAGVRAPLAEDFALVWCWIEAAVGPGWRIRWRRRWRRRLSPVYATIARSQTQAKELGRIPIRFPQAQKREGGLDQA